MFKVKVAYVVRVHEEDLLEVVRHEVVVRSPRDVVAKVVHARNRNIVAQNETLLVHDRAVERRLLVGVLPGRERRRRRQRGWIGSPGRAGHAAVARPWEDARRRRVGVVHVPVKGPNRRRSG